MVLAVPNEPVEVAARFRYYAAVCREYACSGLYAGRGFNLLEQAAHWEKDARMVDRDAQIIAASRALLDRLASL
jgi:hypothetical protein